MDVSVESVDESGRGGVKERQDRGYMHFQGQTRFDPNVLLVEHAPTLIPGNQGPGWRF